MFFGVNDLQARQVAMGEKHWTIELSTDGDVLPVHFRTRETPLEAHILNGTEEIAVTFEMSGERLTIDFPHYASKIVCQAADDGFEGSWRKLRGSNKFADVPCKVVPRDAGEKQDPTKFLGRYAVKFADSEDLAVAEFKPFGDREVIGTFLTTTGDYRYLHGQVLNEELRLSCFDGAHAFLFRAKLVSEETLEGVFSSGNWYHIDWKARLNDDAKLPDAFQQSFISEGKLSDLSFPDLDGKLRSLADDELLGKATLIELFGSWCPNCHDEATYLRELRTKYGNQGLKVIGLAFELTGNQDSDSKQVRRYVERFDIDYPVLIAGISDKADASKRFPLLDRVRSYPTTLFVDSTGEVRAVYTGFSGPATGQAHTRLKSRFEKLIQQLLSE